MNSTTVLTFTGPVPVAAAAASQWVEITLNSGGHSQHVALSGGRITRAFLTHVAQFSLERRIPWASTHFYWADERCVPPGHTDSNYAVAQTCFFAPLKINPDQVHRIQGEMGPDQAAQEACETLLSHVPVHDGIPVLDLVFLGMGEDGHVASLFPGGLAPNASDGPFRAVIGPKPPAQRVTMTYPVLIAARQVWVLVSGSGKKQAWEASLQGGGQTPLGWILQHRNRTTVFLDESALD